jgi:hypothetical protein
LAALNTSVLPKHRPQPLPFTHPPVHYKNEIIYMTVLEITTGETRRYYVQSGKIKHIDNFQLMKESDIMIIRSGRHQI